MEKEKELLNKLAEIRDNDISLPLTEGIALERELAKIYMYQLDTSASDEELIKWGTEFRQIVEQKLKMFREGILG